MIKKIAWDTFKNTGSIDSFLEFKQIQEIEKNLNNSNSIEEVPYNLELKEEKRNIQNNL